jgi:hypothetical protein
VTNANLSNANLTQLAFATLTSATRTGAKVIGTYLGSADLSGGNRSAANFVRRAPGQRAPRRGGCSDRERRLWYVHTLLVGFLSVQAFRRARAA